MSATPDKEFSSETPQRGHAAADMLHTVVAPIPCESVNGLCPAKEINYQSFKQRGPKGCMYIY